MTSFTDIIIRDLSREREGIDETYSTIDTPEGMKNITLYPHQQALVKALIDIEQKRFIKWAKNANTSNVTAQNLVLETSACVLGEKLGAGKTIILIALIVANPIPRPIAQHVNLFDTIHIPRSWTHERFVVDRFVPEVTKTYKKFIKATIVVVGPAVLIQWRDALAKFTNLKIFSIGHYSDMKQFYQEFKSGQINEYDVILMKCTNITSKFILEGEKPEDVPEIRNIVKLFTQMTSSVCWARAVYDDFDSIKANPDTPLINALFTIYVSTTRKGFGEQKITQQYFDNIEELIKAKAPILRNVYNDSVLFNQFVVKCKDKFVIDSMQMPIVEQFAYVYKNPDDKYMQLLGAMGGDAAVYMEMLNGDAIKTAAGALGIESNSVFDIFSKILGQKYDDFIKASNISKNASESLQYNLKMPEKVNAKDESIQHSAIEVDTARKNVERLVKPKNNPPLQSASDTVQRMIVDVERRYTEIKEKNGIAIERVKDNIKEGNCQVCCIPLEEQNAFIVRCCGIVLCDECGVKGAHLKNAGGKNIIGVCPNCRTKLNVTTDMIFVNKDFSLENILGANGDEVEPIVQPVEEEKQEEPEIKNPKLRALKAIIDGVTPENQKKVDYKIKNIVFGTTNKPRNKDKRKILLFANYAETIDIIQNFLDEYKIKYNVLGGTYQQMNDCVVNFRTNDAVIMLINSSQICAGLNIQYCTDIAFFHEIIDPNVSAQLMGRGQRIGRTENLNVHYLLYQNEQMYRDAQA